MDKGINGIKGKSHQDADVLNEWANRFSHKFFTCFHHSSPSIKSK